MATRNIGLSLGADLCWPAAYEALVSKLDLAIPVDGEEVRFDVERVTVEPFGLRYKPKYDVVLDRVTHWHPTSREWIKKITLMDGVYVLNNPWSIQSVEKHTSYCAMMRLGMPIPETWMIPPKNPRGDTWIVSKSDVEATVARSHKFFDLSAVGRAVGYPAFIKPYDGGGWVGVKRVTDTASLLKAYDESGDRVHHLQAAVNDWDVFVRGIGVGPQVNLVRYDPDQPLHGRYRVDFNFLDGDDWVKAQRITRVINAFFNWDFNSCEMLRSNGELHPIDFANACPDSQVTSLHYHFPTLVKMKVRWSLFCAATRRPMRLNMDWQRFFDVQDPDATFDENLLAYDALAQEHFDTDRFEAFCAEHLGDFDTLAIEYFSSDAFYDVVEAKVRSLYPPHEIRQFTDHFFGMVQFWCHTERDRLGLNPPKEVAPAPEAPAAE
ncbi:MAG: hypothetical protein KC656_07245 [Myxococcales bacterium]|nr:hypothetical protein [Myxococcales bacterium]MCB9671093.1 hypothetical protein [Alphaproteobacteria bacterium]MCB9692349.1 hypothetical protein [Alphaproteobacteria bacterium]